MFNLAHGYARKQMSALSSCRKPSSRQPSAGLPRSSTSEVGTGYFDAVTTTVEREASTAALKGLTEDAQFFDAKTGAKKAA